MWYPPFPWHWLSIEYYNSILINLISLFFKFPNSQLAADPDPNVKNGAELLDRLIKVSVHCLFISIIVVIIIIIIIIIQGCQNDLK